MKGGLRYVRVEPQLVLLAKQGGSAPVVIEILDSATYRETLLVDGRNLPGGLVLQAADPEMPVLVKAGAGAHLLTVQNSSLGKLQLDGLVLAGGNLAVGGSVDEVLLRHCSAAPASVSLLVSSADAKLRISRTLCGPLAIAAPDGSIELADSVVQHPSATVEAPAGHAALA